MANFSKNVITKDDKIVNNYIVLTGNLCKDFKTNDKKSVAKSRIACYQGADKEALFINVATFDAANIDFSMNLKKGEAVQIRGSLSSSTHDGKQTFSIIFDRICKTFED
jgi:single-stranded DNA-binding protein